MRWTFEPTDNVEDIDRLARLEAGGETRLATSATIDAKDDDDGSDEHGCIGRELRACQGCGTELRERGHGAKDNDE